MSVTKSYRLEVSGAPGPDYRCGKCSVYGVRLWRQAQTFLDHIELLCAVCATEDQKTQIVSYADFHKEHDVTIGDLVPARPVPEGHTFWGHTSGEVLWWYALPQYMDVSLEMVNLRLERDHQLALNQKAMEREIELYRQINKLESSQRK